jgi:hypothetical protein
LSVFLCSKLEDHYTVSTATLPGINALLRIYSPNGENTNRCLDNLRVFEMIKAISRDIHVQSMIQADRYIVFSIYQFVLASKYHLDLIKSENFDTDLVYGFIQSMDREKGSFIILFKIDEFKMDLDALNG